MAPFANTRRLARLASVLIRHGIAHVGAGRLPRWLGRSLPAAGAAGPERLRMVFEEMGGTFIKFGQMLALQPDLVSLEYCDALFKLLDRVAPFEVEHAERIFAEELGRPSAELFDSFDPVPLATASIGQVYVARLNGRKLAVKVQRPSATKEFDGDVRLMTGAIALIRTLGLRKLAWMIEPMSEFVAWTKEELDFRSEARYAQQLHQNAQSNPAERVPEILREFTTSRTLVMEFLDGITVLNYLRAVERNDADLLAGLREAGFEPDAFARNIIDNFLGDAFRHGMFHADLHPANLMILPGNTVGYIDFGITGVLSRYSRQHLIAMTLAYTRGDVDGMCDSFFRVSATGPESDVDGFRDGLKRMADQWYEMRGRERRLRKNFTLVMLDMLRLSRSAGVWPERDVIKYIRSAIASDGLITRLSPGFEISFGRYLAEVCDRHLSWQSWGEMISYEALLGWSTAGGRLWDDGVTRGAGVLGRMASGDWPVRASLAGAAPDGAARTRVLALARVVFGGSSFLALAGQTPELGVNLFTAVVLLIVAASLLLVRALRRLE